MSVEIAALILDGIVAVGGIASSNQRQRGEEKSVSSAAALHQIEQIALQLDEKNLRLASLMPDGISRPQAIRVLNDPHFVALTREIVLCALLDEAGSDPDALTLAAANRAATVLDSCASEDIARDFGVNVARAIYLDTANIVDQAALDHPNSLSLAKQLGQLKRISSILTSIERHVNALREADDTQRAAEIERFVKEYRAVCAHIHGVIQPPDFEKDQRLPLNDIYVLPSIWPVGSPGLEAEAEEIDMEAFISGLDRTVVLGDPGGGKSTLAAFVATTVAHDKRKRVPLFVTLREYAKVGEERSVVGFLEQIIPSRYQVEAKEGVIEHLLVTGGAIVIFDGLDELIDTSRRRQITAEVEAFALRYPISPVLVTSRRVGYEQARLDPAIFRSYEIADFDEERVESYVQKWFASRVELNAVTADARAADFMAQSEAVDDLRSNPLMLSLMCIIFQGENFIPRKRPAVYEKCANLLFEKWDGHRQIDVPLQAKDHVDAALKYVAFQFLEAGAGDVGIEYDVLVDMMTDYLHHRALDTPESARRAAVEFVDFCRGRAWVFTDAGTTADGELIYTFTHRTFMEYFAAVHIVRTTDSAESLGKALLPRVVKEEWDVVAQLAVQQIDRVADRGTERALRAILNDRRRRSPRNRLNVLMFVIRCLRFAVVSPAFIAEVTRRSFAYYFDNFSDYDGNDRYAPWFELDDSLMERDAPYASEALRALLDRSLVSTDEKTVEASTAAILLGAIRVGNISRSGRTPGPLDVTLFEHGKRVRKFLEGRAVGSPWIWNSMAVGGIVSASEAIDRMRESGFSFAEIYFANSPDDDVVPSSVFADYVMRYVGISRAKSSHDVSRVVEEYSECFIRDFRAVQDRGLLSPGSMPPLLNAGWIFEEAVPPILKSAAERDAVALMALGVFSIYAATFVGIPVHSARPKKERSRADLAASLSRWPLSRDVSEFVSQWSRYEAELFELREEPVW